MQTSTVAARCVSSMLLVCVYGCSTPGAQSGSGAQSTMVPAGTEEIEILTGETSHVVSLEEFVALQEIENLGPIDPGEKLICRREKAVGTHFRSYRCFTKEQLDRYIRASQDWLRAAQYAQQAKSR